jgi:hypothetical protein
VLRRAYRVLLGEGDARPLQVRLTHEARRILIAAAVVLLAGLALVVAGIAALAWVLT